MRQTKIGSQTKEEQQKKLEEQKLIIETNTRKLIKLYAQNLIDILA